MENAYQTRQILYPTPCAVMKRRLNKKDTNKGMKIVPDGKLMFENSSRTEQKESKIETAVTQ